MRFSTGEAATDGSRRKVTAEDTRSSRGAMTVSRARLPDSQVIAMRNHAQRCLTNGSRIGLVEGAIPAISFTLSMNSSAEALAKQFK